MGHTMFSSKEHKLENRLEKEAMKAREFDWQYGESEHHDIHREEKINVGRKDYASPTMQKHMGAVFGKKKLVDKQRAKRAIEAKKESEDHALDDKADARHAGVHGETYEHKAHDETADTHQQEHDIEEGYASYKFDDPIYGELREKNFAKNFGDLQGRHKEIHQQEESHDEREYREGVIGSSFGTAEHKNYALSGPAAPEHDKKVALQEEAEAKKAASKKTSTKGKATYTESQKEALKSKPTEKATVSAPKTVSSSSNTKEKVSALSRSRNRRRNRSGLMKQKVAGT